MDAIILQFFVIKFFHFGESCHLLIYEVVQHLKVLLILYLYFKWTLVGRLGGVCYKGWISRKKRITSTVQSLTPLAGQSLTLTQTIYYYSNSTSLFLSLYLQKKNTFIISALNTYIYYLWTIITLIIITLERNAPLEIFVTLSLKRKIEMCTWF